MRYLVNVDKLIHYIGLAESVAAAKRLRLARACAMGEEGEEMVVITDPKIILNIPYPSEVDDA